MLPNRISLFVLVFSIVLFTFIFINLFQRFSQVQFPQVNSWVPTSWQEARVVFEPGDTWNDTNMRLENVMRWVLSSIKFEHMNLCCWCYSKKLSSIGKWNFTALLYLNRPVFNQLVLEQVHHSNFLWKTNYYVETWRMECNWKGFFTFWLVWSFISLFIIDF